MEKKVICPTEAAILLATYNGEMFLAEQLDSLFAQTFNDITIYVHDDGSTDSTMSILRDYESKYSNIFILEYDSQPGAMNNFFGLLNKVVADYYFFCDQDDVWFPEKVEKSLLRIKQIEKEQGTDCPIGIYSDLCVVDKNLIEIASSFMKTQNIRPQFLQNFNRAAIMNFATGCTMAFNHRAKESIVYPYDKATMHDNWTALCIMKYGTLSPILESLVYYRQHSNNAIGAKRPISLAYKIRNAKKMWQKNVLHLHMIKALGYGSVLKYVYYKMIYKLISKA